MLAWFLTLGGALGYAVLRMVRRRRALPLRWELTASLLCIAAEILGLILFCGGTL